MSQPVQRTVSTRRQKLTTATATTTTLPTLPFELIIEILCNLPVKFLLKLKCVCKSWNSLFSDHKFIKKHLRNSTMNPNLISKSYDSYPKYWREFSHTVYPLRSLLTDDVTIKGTHQKKINFPLNTDQYRTRIVGSCDGLLCLSQGRSPTHGASFQVVVWNPSIRKYKILPSPNFPHHKNYYGTTIYSFGYDHFTGNYKVVAIFICKNNNNNRVDKTQVKVHTLGTDSWRLIEEFPSVISRTSNIILDSGTFLSGTINWLVHIDYCSATLRPIVSLDLGTESYQEILQPDYGEEEVVTYACRLLVLRDCLCILRRHRTNSADIWLMKEYGNRESWIKLVNISYSINYSIYSFISNVFYISEHDQVLLEFWSGRKSLAVYASTNGTMKILEVYNDDILHLPEIYVYVESFIWPCS